MAGNVPVPGELSQLYALCFMLSAVVQAAVQALLEAWPSNKEWRTSLPALAADVSQLGPNHR